MLGVTEPMSCGLGGDLFAIVWDAKTKKLYGLNASGRSPRGLTLEEFQRRNLKYIPRHGPLPVSRARLRRRLGRTASALRQAAAGTSAGPGDSPRPRGFRRHRSDRTRLAGRRRRLPRATRLRRNVSAERPCAAAWRDVSQPGARRHAREDRHKAAATPSTAARSPASIDKFMREVGGFLRYEDLAEHRSEWVEPVSVNYRGYDVWELPPNGQGIAALQMLQMLKGFDLRSAGFGSPDHLHYLVEAKKLAFEDRARFYADPAFYKPPVAELISPAYADKRRSLIDRQHAATNVDAGNPALETGDTIYLTTADKDHNMVSLIQSNFRGFGSGLCPPGLGFCLQNRGELFDLTPGRPNSYAPGKRPFHTIIPAFVTKDGRPVMSFGVMGGDMQPQGHVQILINLLDFDMGLQEAGDAPRVHHIGSTEPTGEPAEPGGGRVQLESGFAPETVRELEHRGHRIVDRDWRIRRLPGHLVRRRKGRLLRRDRVAKGRHCARLLIYRTARCATACRSRKVCR